MTEPTPTLAIGEPIRAKPSAAETVETGLTLEGQRHINRIWEYTQAIVTVTITVAAIANALMNIESDVINFAFVAIISTYYARTNHTKIGGIVGAKYEGR